MKRKIIKILIWSLAFFSLMTISGAGIAIKPEVRQEIFGAIQTGNSCYLHIDAYEGIAGWHYAPVYNGLANSLTFKTAATWDRTITVQGAIYRYTSEPLQWPNYNTITGFVAATEIITVPSGSTNQEITMNFLGKVKLTAGTQYYILVKCVGNYAYGCCAIQQGVWAGNEENHLYGYQSTPFQFGSSLSNVRINSQYVYLYCTYTVK